MGIGHHAAGDSVTVERFQPSGVEWPDSLQSLAPRLTARLFTDKSGAGMWRTAMVMSIPVGGDGKPRSNLSGLVECSDGRVRVINRSMGLETDEALLAAIVKSASSSPSGPGPGPGLGSGLGQEWTCRASCKAYATHSLRLLGSSVKVAEAGEEEDGGQEGVRQFEASMNAVKRQAMQAFTAGLDPVCWSTALLYPTMEGTAYNWMMDAAGQRRMWREQAFQLQPLLVGAAIVTPDDEASRAVLVAIDEGRPLYPVLAGVHALPLQGLCSIQGMTSKSIYLDINKETFVTMLQAIPFNGWPADTDMTIRERQWSNLSEMSRTLMKICAGSSPPDSDQRVFENVVEVDFREALLSSRPVWLKKGVRPMEKSDVLDMAHDVVRRLVLPACADLGLKITDTSSMLESPPDQCSLVSRVLGLRSLHALEKAVVSWHARQRRIGTILESGEHDIFVWPAIFSPLTMGGVHIECIGNSADLRLEGTAMNHCANTYVTSCMYGISHLATLRAGGPSGTRLSTVEFNRSWIKFWKPLKKLEVHQHTSHGNGEPPVEAVDAVEALLDHLQANPGLLHLDQVDQASHAWSRKMEADHRFAMRVRAGYDITQEAIRDKALDLFRFLLPDSTRNAASYADWVEMSGLHAMIAESVEWAELSGDRLAIR